MRRSLVALLSAALLFTAFGPTANASDPREVDDFVEGWSIIPPGQSGAFTSPHRSDQLDMYAGLVELDGVTEADLPNLFHDFGFGPTEVESEITLAPPSGGSVTIIRDGFGIPHIYGEGAGTIGDDAAAYGMGYSSALDRMWHMDILRRAATGRLSEFLGEDFLTTDKDIRRDGYTDAEMQKMYDDLDDDFGAPGAAVQSMLPAYTDGINQYIAEVETGTQPEPAEYVVQGLPIEPWETLDTIALTIFQLRQFGESSGGELRNAAQWQDLRHRLGKRLGKKVFRDLNLRNDADAYPTIPAAEGTWPSQDLGGPGRKARAIPDNAHQVWNKLNRIDASTAKTLESLRLDLPASHFIAVAPGNSETGNPLEWGGPQVGYSVPQFFVEMDVHSPNLDFRGPAVPGASILAPLGRGIDYAWSLTSGVSDAVDTRVERLCAHGTGNVTKQTNSYRYDGKCKKMKRRTEHIQIGIGDEATTKDVKIYRTVHGPVIVRATVDGDPVAVVRERAFWKHEVDTVPAIYQMDSNQMDSIDEFQTALEGWSVSFNVAYIDQSNIGYFHVGTYPKRRKHVDTMLPVWGRKKWDWRGDIEFADLPKMVNPAQGYFTNWNNKPSTGWDNGDSSQWGPTQRVRLLVQGMEALFANGGKATLAEVVDVIRDAATRDGRAEFIGDQMVEYTAGVTGTKAEARAAVALWIAAGAHRADQDGDELQDIGPAVSTFDTWYDHLVHNVFDDELGDTYDVSAVKVSDDPRFGNGSAFYADFSNYLWRLFDPDRRSELARNYCNDRRTSSRESCSEQVLKALKQSVRELKEEQGDDVAAWTWAADYIEFEAAGAVEVDPIPWQNRGTYNHAVEVTGSRP